MKYDNDNNEELTYKLYIYNSTLGCWKESYRVSNKFTQKRSDMHKLEHYTPTNFNHVYSWINFILSIHQLPSIHSRDSRVFCTETIDLARLVRRFSSRMSITANHPPSTIFISSLWRGAEVILPSSPTLIEFYCIDRIYEHFIALYERISIRCVTLNRMSYLTFAFDEEKELICICDLSISMNFNNFIQFFSYIFFPIIYALSCSFLIIFMHFGT